MYIPSFVIVLPCLASFGLCGLRYYQADPDNRLTDRRFVAGSTAVATIFVFLVARVFWPGVDLLPVGFLLFALCLLGYAVRMFRQPLFPPEEPVQTPTPG